MTKTHKFPLGACVVIDPTGFTKGPLARVTGQTTSEDGSLGYTVSNVGQSGAVERQFVSELEIRWPGSPEAQ